MGAANEEVHLMATERIPRPRDPVQLGKLMVDIATGQVVGTVEYEKDTAAAELRRLGGLKGIQRQLL